MLTRILVALWYFSSETSLDHLQTRGSSNILVLRFISEKVILGFQSNHREFIRIKLLDSEKMYAGPGPAQVSHKRNDMDFISIVIIASHF